MTDETPIKEIREMKEFTSVTSIRKFTQQAMAPVIHSIEQQISTLIQDQQQISKKMEKSDDVSKSQVNLKLQIQQINKDINEFKALQVQRKREDERRFIKLETVNESIFVELNSLKTNIETQNQLIKKINLKNSKMSDMYSALSASNDKSLQEIQLRYSDFTKNTLQITKNVRQEYEKVSIDMEVLKSVIATERNAIEEKSKNLDLYLSERDIAQTKFEELYSMTMNSVTRQDFQGYRKSQKVFIDDLFSKLHVEIDNILSPSLKEQLPFIDKKLKEVEKLKKIQQICTDLEFQVNGSSAKISQIWDKLTFKIEELNKKSQQKNKDIQRQFHKKMQTMLEQSQKHVLQQLQATTSNLKQQFQQQLQTQLQQQSQQLQRVISSAYPPTPSPVFQHEPPTPSLHNHKQVQKTLEEVYRIKEQMMERYNHIQELGLCIDEKIENYSSRITRIRTDYDLFSDAIRKEVNSVLRFKETFFDRLQDIGKMLSYYTETLFMLMSVTINKYEEEHREHREPIVFVTENDGIVYESRPDSEKGWITYRKEKMETRQFLKACMYSLVTFTDNQFSQMSFLNWKAEKPSSFFKETVFSNYLTNIKRLSEAMEKEKQKERERTRRASTFSAKNQTYLGVQQVDKIHNDNSKFFSRTIETKFRFDKVLEEGGQQNEQNKKGYSIKMTKTSSGRPSTKQKKINDQSRYDQVFLTSRSACRSRISQAI